MENARILIAHRDPKTSSAWSTELIAAGHIVEEAADGPDAVSRVRAGPFELAVIDLLIPPLGALPALEEIKRVRPSTVVAVAVLFKEFESAADEFADTAQQQSPKPGLRQADHAGLQLLRPQLRAGDQPVRPCQLPERRCAADSVQSARPLRLEHRRVRAVRSVRCQPQRPFIHAGGRESHILPGPNRL